MCVVCVCAIVHVGINVLDNKKGSLLTQLSFVPFRITGLFENQLCLRLDR